MRRASISFRKLCTSLLAAFDSAATCFLAWHRNKKHLGVSTDDSAHGQRYAHSKLGDCTSGVTAGPAEDGGSGRRHEGHQHGFTKHSRSSSTSTCYRQDNEGRTVACVLCTGTVHLVVLADSEDFMIMMSFCAFRYYGLHACGSVAAQRLHVLQ